MYRRKRVSYKSKYNNTLKIKRDNNNDYRNEKFDCL